MIIPHKQFCLLPWISIEASPIGTVRPCCLADDEIVDNNGDKFELARADFGEIQNSNYMRELRRDFLLFKKPPPTCRKCWAEESAGRTSKRMHTLDRLKHIMTDTEWSEDPKPLMFLDLKLGNICNLKCRICGSWSSSQYATEEINDTPPAERKQTFAYQMLRAGAWPRENTNFWNQIDHCLTDIRYIEFTGGEPFLIDEHFDMLQGIVDRGIAHNVEIHYNTNGTQFPTRGPEIWQHFRTVEIALSIDDLEQRFEYQRSNARWSEVLENTRKFMALRDAMPNIQLQCCSTVNVFNVLYLDRLARWIDQQRFDFVYWNIMHDAWYYSIANLPRAAKTAINQHLSQADIPVKFRDEFFRIRDFMNRGPDSDGKMMLMNMRDLDRKRNQNLATVEPELAKIINYANV